MTRRTAQVGLAVALVLLVVAGLGVIKTVDVVKRTNVVGYFANSNGIFVGDEVRILGIEVGHIDAIEPEGNRVKIRFWYDSAYKVPANANAVILSPALVSARAIQLTPVYRGGPLMTDNSVIPRERTAVPVEWDDLRAQLDRLGQTLQPTQPGGVSSLGALVNTAADNLRGEGANIREAVIRLSQTFSALGDHSGDVFSTVKNLSLLVSALQDSTDLMRLLNGRLAAVTQLLADDPDEVAHAIKDLNVAIGDVHSFVAENRDAIGLTSDRAASITQALVDSIDDLKQTLHVAPNTLANFANLYHPALGGSQASLAINNFANPITFLCGAIQAASRLGAEQASKLCVQYLAPIIKNRQYNFPPIGTTLGLAGLPVVAAGARPNEITYSEDWMRPDYIPPQASPPQAAPPPPAAEGASGSQAPLAAEAAPPEAVATDPAAGLPGMMVPTTGGGS
jgi:phospholipid/cholesterol/gamma-HCH transport system substrate-binding protein